MLSLVDNFLTILQFSDVFWQYTMVIAQNSCVPLPFLKFVKLPNENEFVILQDMYW